MNEINEFQGEHRWLSNFWPCSIIFEGLEYPSVEHAFVAAKTIKMSTREVIQKLKLASDAKKVGRALVLRPNWDSMKKNIMEKLLVSKFTRNEELKQKLIDTGDAELIEGNNWNDTYWGVCNGVGKNTLGILLMKVRETL